MNDMTHYMESTSRLRAENKELRMQLEACQENEREDLATAERQAAYNIERAEAAEAIMREVAEEMRNLDGPPERYTVQEWADRLAPPVVENTSA